VLLYDAECKLCRCAARVVARLDRGHDVALLPLQDPAARALLAELNDDERLSTWRLLQPDGSTVGYGAGLPSLLATLRATRWLGRALERAPDRALDGLYTAIARNRGMLGRLVPGGDAPRRYP
jgi:predicted DCC family thiol-disulfide oxidoreductase YuxK